MSDTTTELTLLGNALEHAWRLDHRRAKKGRSRRSRLLIVVALLALVLGGGAALATTLLKTASEEETGMVGGYQLFAGSQPRCQARTATSFHCVLAKSPTGMTFYDADGRQIFDVFLGVKAETVDSHRRVDGACVSVTADGRAWNCYLGQEAVERGVLNPGRLGTYLAEPPTG